jgi:L-Ala-D/L-Glu epimerase / N-acetyl-D-glutamate racemase
MQFRLHRFDLPLKYPFTIARGTVTVQQTLIVELTEDGHSGYGEATTNSYYTATYDGMIAALESVRSQLEVTTLTDPTRLWADMSPHFAGCSFALCALDEAAHDLWGKKLGSPVHKLWGLTTDNLPPSNFTIGLDALDRMVAKLHEMPGWPIYKIKLGSPNDVAIVRELRRHTDAIFRGDANGGWTADEAIAKSRELATLGVEFIEQPLPAGDWAGTRRVFAESALPVVADESCITESDVDRCAGHFHGINIKLVKCGGLTPARRMIDCARQLGLNVMFGCMTESTVGISAIAQLLPLLDYVDMDGAALLARDIATGVRLDHGRCIYPQENGTGVRLDLMPATSECKPAPI